MARFVFFSHTAADSIFRVGSHHYAREIAQAGHDVLRVAIPKSPLRRIVRDREGIRSVRLFGSLAWTDEDGARHLQMDLPSPLGRGPTALQKVVNRIGARTVSRHLQSTSGSDTYYVVDEPRFVGLLQYLPRATTIYRPTDIQDHQRTRSAERKMAPISDAVVVTNKTLHDHLPPQLRSLPSTVIANGVQIDHLLAQSSVQERRGAVYVGSLDQRFCWDTMNALAAAFSNETFDVYGPLPNTTPSMPSNCNLRGPLEYRDLPRVLQAARVGLLPLSQSELNEGRSPMKLFEYLGAGLSVVASYSPSFAELEPPSTYLYRGHKDAVRALEAALREPIDPAGIEMARAQSWSKKAHELTTFAEGIGASQ